MSYLARQPLGGVEAVLSAAKAATAVVADPCLGTVANLVLKLQSMEKKAPRPPGVPAPLIPGIGLCSAVDPLKKVIWVKERPWFLPVAGVAVVGGLIGVGYLLGRKAKR